MVPSWACSASLPRNIALLRSFCLNTVFNASGEMTATLNNIIDDLKQCILHFVRALLTSLSGHPTHCSQISHPSDLRNVRLIFRQWHCVAAKRLYERVELSGGLQLLIFDHCVEFDAARHLQHTRELSILERWDPDIRDNGVRGGAWSDREHDDTELHVS